MPKNSGYAAHAMNIAEIVSKAAHGFFRGRLGVEFKADESPVTHADKCIETDVRTYLTEHFPDNGVFGEEHGTEGGQREQLWVIDPIDGTRSFLSGIRFCIETVSCLRRASSKTCRCRGEDEWLCRPFKLSPPTERAVLC